VRRKIILIFGGAVLVLCGLLGYQLFMRTGHGQANTTPTLSRLHLPPVAHTSASTTYADFHRPGLMRSLLLLATASEKLSSAHQCNGVAHHLAELGAPLHFFAVASNLPDAVAASFATGLIKAEMDFLHACVVSHAQLSNTRAQLRTDVTALLYRLTEDHDHAEA